MKTSLKEIELNFKVLDLYKIVLDIEKYPEYIPWCSSLEIINRKKNEIRAKMVVNYKFIYSQKFTSCVFFDLKKKIIKTKYIDGPLKDLETNWEFIDLKKNKTKILFSLKFEFKKNLHQKIAEIFFPIIEDKMVDSFVERANKLLN